MPDLSAPGTPEPPTPRTDDVPDEWVLLAVVAEIDAWRAALDTDQPEET